MNITLEQLYQLIGETQVKIRLLESENAQLRLENEKLKNANKETKE